MITTHILDLASGRPAHGVPVVLEAERREGWVTIGRGTTDEHGRLATLTDGLATEVGSYRLVFDLAAYLREQRRATPFFPSVTVVFTVQNAAEHYHVPLLISPFGYTVYRGS